MIGITSLRFLLQHLLQIVAGVTQWQVVNLTENGIAEFLVKGQRLETHGVEVRSETAAPDGFLVGDVHQARSAASAAYFVVNPDDVDGAPAPVGRAEQAAFDRAAFIPDEQVERAVVVFDLRTIEGVETLAYDLLFVA